MNQKQIENNEDEFTWFDTIVPTSTAEETQNGCETLLRIVDYDKTTNYKEQIPFYQEFQLLVLAS